VQQSLLATLPSSPACTFPPLIPPAHACTPQPTPTPSPTPEDPDAEPSWLQSVLLGPGSHLALAILCSKACIPVKVPVAAVLTPYVYR
jgi:hypothetical protein